ncbi:hypothetical protein [Nocardia barduliensis]|uniref:hypothetical protein n=1 Tax=Nocardia barduliensis TaxID=2736643 RepID=UPI001C2CE05E|nr:hypothetical protein [Nocardia barduliensis]
MSDCRSVVRSLLDRWVEVVVRGRVPREQHGRAAAGFGDCPAYAPGARTGEALRQSGFGASYQLTGNSYTP